MELNSTGTGTAVNVWGASGLLSRRTGAASVFYTFDPQGSVVQRLDGSQNILSTSAYDAWGNPLAATTGDPFGYCAEWGYYTDSESGLLLLTHRYYDPGQGRFVTRDPMGYSGGVNLYGYVGNGASSNTDITGTSGGDFQKKDRSECLDIASNIMKIEKIIREHNDKIEKCRLAGIRDNKDHIKEVRQLKRELEKVRERYRKQCEQRFGPPEELAISADDQPVVDETWKLAIPFIRVPIPDIEGAWGWLCGCARTAEHAFAF